MRSVIDAITINYFGFSGRTNRKEFLYYLAFYVLTIFVCLGIDIFVSGQGLAIGNSGLFVAVIASILSMPSFAICSRRLHDFNRSGWFTLLIFVPIIDLIFLLLLCLIKGTEGSNLHDPIES